MVSNRDLIKFVFDDDIYKMNKWFFKADWKKAEIIKLETESKVLNVKYIIWNSGVWKNGTWNNGVWKNGIWKYGYWMNGTWYGGAWERGFWENGTWHGGDWGNGWWYNGTWINGTWKDGVWKDGVWEKGKIWNFNENKYIESKVSPNECKWSLSYGK